MQERPQPLKAPLFASLALAFASLGDAFLYPFLPVNHAAVGVPVAWIGVLLSVNRFVRMVCHAWIVHVLARHGLRVVSVAAAVVALLSTAGYAVAASMWVWLLLRMGWGLAFAALRLATLGYSLRQPNPGFALGLTRGVQEAGPLVALFLAPLLLPYLTAGQTFVVLAALSLPALYFSWRLPGEPDQTPAVGVGHFWPLPSVVNTLTFLSAFLIDGMVVVVLGLLFLGGGSHLTPLAATSLAALYLGYRRVCLVLLSPSGGWLADRLGMARVFYVSLALTLAGLLALALGAVAVGAVVAFTFYSVHAAITPGYVAQHRTDALATVAANATWRDMGAAAGTLAGGFLLSTPYVHHMLVFAIFGMAILVVFHWGIAQRALKFLYLWK